jgi:hypothetical protein
MRDLYHSAFDAGAADRAELLAQADPEVRREVESLLAQPAADTPLDRPCLACNRSPAPTSAPVTRNAPTVHATISLFCRSGANAQRPSSLIGPVTACVTNCFTTFFTARPHAVHHSARVTTTLWPTASRA